MRICKITALSLLFIIIVFANSAFAIKNVQRDNWYGIYLGEIKLGYIHTKVDTVKFRGEDAYCVLEVCKAKFGAFFEIDSETKTYLNADYSPIYESYTEKVKEGLKTKKKTVEIEYSKNKIHCKVNKNGAITKKSIRIPPSVNLKTSNEYSFGVKKIKVGDRFKTIDFSSENVDFIQYTHNVVKKEKVEIDGHLYDAFVVDMKDDIGNKSTSWTLDDGSEIKSREDETGAICILESREKAIAGVGDADLPNMNPEVKSNHRLPDDVLITKLNVQLNIADKSIVLNDERQKARFLPDKNVIDYLISADQFDESKSIELPVKGVEFEKYLASTDAIQANDKAIQSLAREIVGNETDAYKAACKIHKWVYENIEKDQYADTALSAVKILKKKTGDCKHCALLYAALARAVGIPTKLVGGLLGYGSSFWGHEWAESYVGDWITIDCTRPDVLPHAEYIKLDISDDMVRFDVIVKMVQQKQKIKADILSYTYLKKDKSNNLLEVTWTKPILSH